MQRGCISSRKNEDYANIDKLYQIGNEIAYSRLFYHWKSASSHKHWNVSFFLIKRTEQRKMPLEEISSYLFWIIVVHDCNLLSFIKRMYSVIYLHLALFIPLEFFASVLADGFSPESEWQQVSSSLQDSSQDSGRSQQCCHLDSLYPSANFQVLQAF